MSPRTEALWARLSAGEVLVSDGAIGTLLQSMGMPPGLSPEVWVVEQPDQIRALHRGYLVAGSHLILTCTFGGTRFRLSGHGLAERVVEVNRRAAELARAEAGDDAFVAGDLGPTGKLLKPFGPLTPEDVAAAFAEQASGLVEGGVDLLLIETMGDLGEARAAIEGVRRVTDLPIICTFSFDTHGHTMMGVKPVTVAEQISPLVQGIGANCGKDPAEYAFFLKAMRSAAPDALLWAKPNAGLPRIVDEQAIYEAAPSYMGQIALELCQAGAQVIGSCCGTTPDHIRAMAKALKNQPC
jgi:5-methyltetrahydrofolate--homocysteine methyltransferase